MSTVIHAPWTGEDASPLIMPGSIPLATANVNAELTQYLQDSWKAIIDADVGDVFGSDYHPGNYVFTFEDGAHHTRTPSGSLSTVSRQRQDYRGSRSTICGTPTPRVRSKQEYNPRWSATALAMRMLASSCRPTRMFSETMTETPPSRPPHSFSGGMALGEEDAPQGDEPV
jgi:hypothetical protein